jgi:hypothetical protein
MVRVTVTPREFHLVAYDAKRIAELASEVAGRIELPEEVEVRVEVDEASPLGRARLTSLHPVTVSVHSGAFEHPKRPRQLREESVVDVLGRLLMRARDRLDPAFGDPPLEQDLGMAESVAWDAYSLGRLAQLGYSPSKGRRRYHFRVRHGFSDLSDQVFDRIWDAEGLTWADVVAACKETGSLEVVG